MKVAYMGFGMLLVGVISRDYT